MSIKTPLLHTQQKSFVCRPNRSTFFQNKSRNVEETSDAAIEKSGEAENEEKEAKTNDFPLVGFFPFGPIAQKQ